MISDVRITLHENEKEPLAARIAVSSEMTKAAYNDAKVSISIQNDVGYSSITIPMGLLSMLMERVTRAAAERSPLIVPPKGIIVQ